MISPPNGEEGIHTVFVNHDRTEHRYDTNDIPTSLSLFGVSQNACEPRCAPSTTPAAANRPVTGTDRSRRDGEKLSDRLDAGEMDVVAADGLPLLMAHRKRHHGVGAIATLLQNGAVLGVGQ
jgi:hypothetical protein